MHVEWKCTENGREVVFLGAVQGALAVKVGAFLCISIAMRAAPVCTLHHLILCFWRLERYSENLNNYTVSLISRLLFS